MLDRTDNQSGSTPGGGTRNPNAALSGAVAQIHAGLDALAAIDPATLSEYGLGDDAVSLLRARRRLDAATAMVSVRFSHGTEWSAYRQPEHCLAAQESLVVIARNLAPKEFKAALMTLAHRADPAEHPGPDPVGHPHRGTHPQRPKVSTCATRMGVH